MKRSNRIRLTIALTGVILLAAPAVVLAYPINNPDVPLDTLVGKGKPGSSGHYGTVDHIGDDYDLIGANVTIDSDENTLTIRVYSAFDGTDAVSGISVRPADIALDLGETPDGVYEYGIALADGEAGMRPGVAAGDIFSLPASGDGWLTSQDYFEAAPAGSLWYGKFVGESEVAPIVHVDPDAQDVTNIGTAEFSSGIEEGDYYREVILDMDFAGDNWDQIGFSLFIASANCANDIMEIHIDGLTGPTGGTVTPAPTPAAFVLLASGLFGFVFSRKP